MKLCLLALNADNFGIFEGCVVAVTGIFTVIIILALIAIVISIAASIIYKVEHRGEKKVLRKTVKTAPEPVPAPAPQPAAQAEPEKAETFDDKELIAVITAAIAASLGTSSDKLIVRSFRKSTNWHKEAIHEQRQHTIVI